MNRKKSTIAAIAALFASAAFAVGPGGNVSATAAADSNGLLAIQNGGDCASSGGVDATTSDWSWTKPTLEVSTDTGATFTSAANNQTYGAMVCRGAGMNGSSPSYWFIVMSPGGNDDMGQQATAANILFRVTIPMKTGDTALRLMGYSRVSSFKIEPTKVTAIVGASGVSKVNTNPRDNFFTVRHPECNASAGVDMAMGQCSFRKADRDIQGMVIQHITYTTSTPSSFQSLTQGVWIGANVSGFNLNVDCATFGSDNNGSGGGSSSGNYSGNDGGSNMPASTSTGSLEVSMSGTPHFKSDGATLNSGSLQAFVPESTARKCFGDGTDTIALTSIASAISVTRTESTEGTSTPSFTATAVTSPVAGLQIDVPTMTFSNPTYKVKSGLVPMKQMKKGKTATLKSILKPTTGAKNVKYSVKGSACSIKGSSLLAKKVGTCTVTLKQTVTSRVNGKKVTKTVTSTKKIKVS